MLMRCLLTLPILLCLPAPSQYCREKLEPPVTTPASYADEYAEKIKETKTPANLSAGHFNSTWIYLPYSKEKKTLAEYYAWGERYKQRFDDLATQKKTGPDPLEEMVKPEWWEVGEHGFSNLTGTTPPWAKEPKNLGRPLNCYIRFQTKRKCSLGRFYWHYNKPDGWRFFYDPYDNRCKRFWYYGCEGNENIFFSHPQCTRTCIKPALPDVCSTDSGYKHTRDRSYHYEMYP